MKAVIVRWLGPLALACGLLGAATDVHAAPAPTPITAPAATSAAPSGEPKQQPPITQALADALDPATIGAPTEADVPTSGARTALQILVLMTLLSLLPAIALTMTCFTRIIIVFSFLRQALGLPGAPPNQVLTGMAIFLTLFVMAPVFSEVNTVAIEPMQRGEITTAEALDRGSQPLAQFMLRHTADEDLRMMYEISKRPRPATREEVSLIVLIPAYTLSEVRTAFTMGFLVLVPFLVIDLVVSSVLMAMGMVMLPPALITLPLKVLVFILADGWGLVIQSLVRSLTG